MVLGIEDLMLYSGPSEEGGKHFRLLNRYGTDQDGLSGCMDLLNFLRDCQELLLLVVVDEIGEVDSLHRSVGGDHDDIEVVDLLELVCLGIGGTGHA